MVDTMNHEMKHMITRILEMRYTDLREELRLCRELLAWAIEHDDSYGRAFALTYSGDYYIAVYDERNAGRYLLEAQELLQESACWDSLRLRIYSLLGILYDIRADEQNAVEYYLQAIALAEQLGDVEGECVSLNNLAFVFQRHCCYEESLDYYGKAYNLQSSLENSPFRGILLGNMAEVCLLMNNIEAARKYIEECACAKMDPYQRDVQGYKNWCGYYSALGEKEKALEYAELLLQNHEVVDEDKLVAFETYYTLCMNMMDLGDAPYAERFLNAMEESRVGNGVDQTKALEDARIRYALLFEPEEEHLEVYHRFYVKNEKLREKINETIVDAMKSKIHLNQLMNQTERIQSEQEILELEVNKDELTGIYNRRYLEILMREWADGTKTGVLGFIMLDVDYFKEYNDYYGHVKGDMVLKEIAACLSSGRNNISSCRYGGDEFVCVCDNLQEEEIIEYIEYVRNCLHKKGLSHEKSLCCKEVTLSIGYAMWGSSAQTEVYSLFQLADQALYQSKRSGRNTFTKKRVDVL